MKTLLLLIGLSFLSINSYAQAVNSAKVKIEVYKPLNVNFRCAKVIDNRLIQSNIGYKEKGAGDLRVPLALPDTFDIYMKEVFRRLLWTSDKSKEQLVIIFHDLNISEQSVELSEKGVINIKMEFAREIDSTLYSLGHSEIRIEEVSKNVSKTHSDNLKSGIIKCLQDFSSSDWQNKEGKKIQLKSNDKSILDAKNVVQPGLYPSLYTLAKQEPLPGIDYSLKYVYGEFPHYLLQDENKKKFKFRIDWICDNSSIYINALKYSSSKYFVKSKLIGRYIYFEDIFTYSSGPGIVAGSAAAGLIGGAIVAAATTIGRGLILDTKSGEITVLTMENMKKLLSEYPEIKEVYYNSKKNLSDKMEAIKSINLLY